MIGTDDCLLNCCVSLAFANQTHFSVTKNRSGGFFFLPMDRKTTDLIGAVCAGYRMSWDVISLCRTQCKEKKEFPQKMTTSSDIQMLQSGLVGQQKHC